MAYQLEKKRKEYLGKKFMLNCGMEVEVIEYNSSRDCTILGTDGRVRSCATPELLSGEVGWFGLGKNPPPFEVGQEFTLRCGTVVKVVCYADRLHITVEDEYGNQKHTTRSCLLNKSVYWVDFGSRRTSRMHDNTLLGVGDKYQLCNGEDVTVLEYTNSMTVLIGDSAGNSKVVTSSALRRGYVSWPWRTNSAVKHHTGYYVYFVLHKCQIVYIGKGKDRRISHPTSGRSSCYELNKLHFEGETVEVVIYKDGMTSDEASVEEMKQIHLLNPPFNKKRTSQVAPETTFSTQDSNYLLTGSVSVSKVDTSADATQEGRTTNLARTIPAINLKRKYYHEPSATNRRTSLHQRSGRTRSRHENRQRQGNRQEHCTGFQRLAHPAQHAQVDCVPKGHSWQPTCF